MNGEDQAIKQFQVNLWIEPMCEAQNYEFLVHFYREREYHGSFLVDITDCILSSARLAQCIADDSTMEFASVYTVHVWQ